MLWRNLKVGLGQSRTKRPCLDQNRLVGVFRAAPGMIGLGRPDQRPVAMVQRADQIPGLEALNAHATAWRVDQRALRKTDHPRIVGVEKTRRAGGTGKNDAFVARCAVGIELRIVRIVDKVALRVERIRLGQDAVILLVRPKLEQVIIVTR